MNAYYENQKLKELQEQTDIIKQLSADLKNTLEELKYNTELKRKMLEMLQEDQVIKEKFQAYNIERN